MSVRLLVKQKNQEGSSDKGTEVVLDEEEILLGRDKACQVVLAEHAVSRSHAKITRDGALCFLEDLGSAYGTRLNGKGLPKGEKRLLRNGDIINIAQFDLTFDRISDVPKGAGRGEKTSMVARQAVKDVMRGLGSNEGPYLRVMNGPKEGERIPLAEAAELTFGREEGADIVLKDDLVSRRHAKIRRDWSGTHMEDLGSRNGIKVNKKRVQRKTLHDKDEVEVGGVRFLYVDPAEVRDPPVVLPAEDESEGVDPTVAKDPEEIAQEEAAPPEEEAPPPEEEAPPEPQMEGEDGMGMEGDEGMYEEPMPEEEPLPPGWQGLMLGGLRALKQPRILVPVASLTVFAILALVLTILVLVGA
jgi:pSer/pThr/pTyr-binding forkhead associated (FHA) protein